MPHLAQSLLIGSWRIVRTEPAPTDPSAERFLHFSPDFQHYWEHPFATGDLPRLVHFRYRMTETGVFVTPSTSEKGWEVPFQVDGDCLAFSGAESCWWLRRISPDERPAFLAHYYEPPVDYGFA